jgi:HK97 family phage major capsid protein
METDAYRSAFMKGVTQAQPVFTPEEARAVLEARAASLTDGAGGYGVPVTLDSSIILTGQGYLNPMRRISRQVTITSDVWAGVSSAGVSWSFDAEAAAVSDDAPTLVQPTITPAQARGFIPYSIQIGEDYPSFAAEFGALLSEGYDYLQATAFITGSGTNAPKGILTALDANTNVEVTPTTDGTFTATDIDKVWTALPDRAKANATWLMSSDVASYIGLWGDAYGGRTVDLAGVPTTLRGAPLAIASGMPDFTGTTGASNILIVGNFRNYVIVDRAGMSVEFIPHLFDVTDNRPTGQRGLFAHARVGGGSVDDTSFRLLQNQ